MDVNPYQSPKADNGEAARVPRPPPYYRPHTLLIVLATLSFVGGVFLNNVTFATNDYAAIVTVAGVAFVFAITASAFAWRIQSLAGRAWITLVVYLSVIELFDVARRLL